MSKISRKIIITEIGPLAKEGTIPFQELRPIIE
jgi:hypothetical protein